MIWLSVICCGLICISAALALKIALMKKDVDSIENEFAEKLQNDTNTLLTVSSNDPSIRRLAANINGQLKILRRQRLRYEQGDSELKNAIANISHDLRTPLTAIDGYLDLLENEEKSQNAERYVQIIRNRTDMMKQLTKELFRYSIITSPDYDAPKERIALNAVLEDCIAGHYSSLRQARIVPEIRMPASPVYCTANRMALSRIFSNLIGNAIKYSDGDLCISLTDKGEIVFSNAAPNLTTVQKEKLFNRFYTVENARKSTGLGLAIAKILVEQSGGTIEAKYDAGRLFLYIRLPIDDAGSLPNT